jgi:hypothetical protein
MDACQKFSAYLLEPRSLDGTFGWIMCTLRSAAGSSPSTDARKQHLTFFHYDTLLGPELRTLM